jgi:hypothetical protein
MNFAEAPSTWHLAGIVVWVTYCEKSELMTVNKRRLKKEAKRLKTQIEE